MIETLIYKIKSILRINVSKYFNSLAFSLCHFYINFEKLYVYTHIHIYDLKINRKIEINREFYNILLQFNHKIIILTVICVYEIIYFF